MDIQIFLRNLPAFEEFSPAHLETLASLLSVSDFPAGHCFIRQGRQGDGFYLVMDGMVELSRGDTPDSASEVVAEFGSGEVFGLLSLVRELPAPQTCVARTPVRAACLSAAAYASLFELALPIARHLQYMIAVQLARELRDENQRQRERIAAQRASGA